MVNPTIGPEIIPVILSQDPRRPQPHWRPCLELRDYAEDRAYPTSRPREELLERAPRLVKRPFRSYRRVLFAAFVDEFVIKNKEGEVLATLSPDDPSDPNNEELRVNLGDLVSILLHETVIIRKIAESV